jgi:hypothetical protein
MDVRTKNTDVSKVVFHPQASPGKGKIFFIKQAILNKEVNCTDPSPFVRVP